MRDVIYEDRHLPISITINNQTFSIPVPGEDPGWGEDTTAWINEISKVVNNFFGTGDILESSASIANDQTVAQAITGLAFDPATVRAAVIEYSVYRLSDTETSGNIENGTILVAYDNNATVGSKWVLSRDYSGESGVDIDITDAGQLTYLSDDIGTSNYSGIITFRARALTQ
jgi:hypothetical protein